ncbi:RluA family pseudouridine synthase [Peribacillus deserti]|uniref:Pseudouridine synthase n=1 Tax=Peribacillus deserti TaxID=673318 RepID=A0A2N5M7U7_9BACI|nr:RluA family pseudouridine synthase [Peribacillus deserti]PLT30429.1 RNA pseudouridine synthase [Peribacillus deserti]
MPEERKTGAPFHLEWTAEERDLGRLLREFLAEQHISRASLTDIKYNGGRILVDGEEVTVRYILKPNDKIKVIFPKEQISTGLIKENLPLDIVYEDHYLMVISKPPLVNTIPSRDRPAGSIANAIAGYYDRNNISSTIHIVTRLDRDTSGLMLIAKHRHVHHLLSEQQKSGTVNRYYEAIVEGVIAEDRRIIDEPIGRKETSIIEREVREDGKPARTIVEVKEKLPTATHVYLKLMTGRTHQIRVHMSHIGYPLTGDDLYGGSRRHIKRQALHCRKLSFYHPFLRKELTFTKEMPPDMSKALDELSRMV